MPQEDEPKPECRHRWKNYVQTGNYFKFMVQRCAKCGATRRRLRTGKDAAKGRAAWRREFRPKPHENVHHVWHKFVEYFFKSKIGTFPAKGSLKKGRPFKMVNKRYKCATDCDFKWEGYTLMKKIREWAKQYPKDIFWHRCDDQLYAGSDVFYILHRSRYDYHGATVLVVPQCHGKPFMFFLYPGHMDQMFEMLSKIIKTHPRLKRQIGWSVKEDVVP